MNKSTFRFVFGVVGIQLQSYKFSTPIPNFAGVILQMAQDASLNCLPTGRPMLNRRS